MNTTQTQQLIDSLRRHNAQLQQQVDHLQRQLAAERSQRPSGPADFLTGAAEIALGVGGGLLAADFIGDLW